MRTPAERRALQLVLLAVALLYVALGMTLGFVQGGIAPILRARGADLGALRWVFLLFLPFGLTFLWAPWVDRLAWPWLGRRTGWIVAGQGVAVAAVLALAAGPERPVAAWLALGLVVTVAMATVDVALDALTVERIAAADRPLAAAAKVGGLSAGAIVGGGAMTALFGALGWTASFLVMAALMALTTLPVAALARLERGRPDVSRAGASLHRALRRPEMRQRLLRISLMTIAMMALLNFNRLMLVDLAVPLERIGWVLGIGAPLANLCAAVVLPLLLRRFALRTLTWSGVAGCALAVAAIVAAIGGGRPGLALAASILSSACLSALFILLGAHILGWAEGTQAATDYALLYSFGRLVGTLALMGMPSLILQIGWPAFYGLALLALAGATRFFCNHYDANPPRSTHG